MFQKTHSQYILFLMFLNIFYKYYFGTSQGYIFILCLYSFRKLLMHDGKGLNAKATEPKHWQTPH